MSFLDSFLPSPFPHFLPPLPSLSPPFRLLSSHCLPFSPFSLSFPHSPFPFPLSLPHLSVVSPGAGAGGAAVPTGAADDGPRLPPVHLPTPNWGKRGKLGCVHSLEEPNQLHPWGNWGFMEFYCFQRTNMREAAVSEDWGGGFPQVWGDPSQPPIPVHPGGFFHVPGKGSLNFPWCLSHWERIPCFLLSKILSKFVFLFFVLH